MNTPAREREPSAEHDPASEAAGDRFDAAGHPLLLNRAVSILCTASGSVSIGRTFGIAAAANQWKLHLYVSGWLLALIIIFATTPRTGALALALTGLAFYRLQDLLFASLSDALELGFQHFNWRGRLIILLVNIAEIVLIFGIANYVLSDASTTAASGSGHRFDALFASWVNFPPLGGGSVPTTVGARALTMAETGVGFLMVVMALSAFISRRS
jgi:hypothetical protein